MADFYRRINNNFTEAKELAKVVSAFSAQAGIPASAALHIDVVIEELISNIIKYGYDDAAAHSIEITLGVRGNSATLTLRDDGHFFDPVAHNEKNRRSDRIRRATTAPVDVDRLPVGGWGLMLVRKSAGKFAYRREDNHNLSTLSFDW